MVSFYAVGENTEVFCPIFHMKCLPYIIGEERKATINIEKTELEPECVQQFSK